MNSSSEQDLFNELSKAEREIAEGAPGEDFAVVAELLRKMIEGNSASDYGDD